MPDVPRYVVDASVAAKWHLSDEEWVEPSLRVLADFTSGRNRLIAPDLLRHELASTLVKATRPAAGRSRILVESAQRSLDQFSSLGIELLDHELIPATAFRLALRLSCSYYDAVYLATSELTNTPMLYADGRLKRSLEQHFPLAVWIEDYPFYAP